MSQRTADESYIAWLQGAPPAAAGATTTIQYKVQSIFVYDACFTAQVAGQHWLRCLSAWVRGFTSRRSVPGKTIPQYCTVNHPTCSTPCHSVTGMQIHYANADEFIMPSSSVQNRGYVDSSAAVPA
eukprot:GHUV01027840.1.p2 GENE.GHUV01027840.1~~GHUV01027840.1.p2  ORF type:complete len:126 (+),score=15.09 GHUV01027840.1:223-600(+)